MKKQIALYAIVAAALVAAPTVIRAEDTEGAKPEAAAPAAGAKKQATTVSGAVTAVDATAMTIAVGEKIFSVTSETKITKDKNPAQLSDIAVGDNVKIGFKKDGDKLVAKSITSGQADKAEGKGKGKGKGKKKAE